MQKEDASKSCGEEFYLRLAQNQPFRTRLRLTKTLAALRKYQLSVSVLHLSGNKMSCFHRCRFSLALRFYPIILA